MSYSFFAVYYDKLTENVNYSEKAEYLVSLFERMGHEPGVVLDLACGTGSMTIELKKRGMDIFGVDASVEMLSEAQAKAFENELEIMFIHQKMQRLELPGLVDTVICTLDSVNHIVSASELTKAFERVAKYLSEDGLFVFDANTVYKHREILGDNCFIYDTDEVFCAWQNDYNPEDNRVLITLDFFEPCEDKYERSTEQFSERAYTREEMSGMLQKAGLEIVSVYGDMSFEPPAQTEQREIYIVRKIRIE